MGDGHSPWNEGTCEGWSESQTEQNHNRKEGSLRVRGKDVKTKKPGGAIPLYKQAEIALTPYQKIQLKAGDGISPDYWKKFVQKTLFQKGLGFTQETQKNNGEWESSQRWFRFQEKENGNIMLQHRKNNRPWSFGESVELVGNEITVGDLSNNTFFIDG